MTDLPPQIGRKEVQARLLLIFPEGTDHKAYLTREIAASTVFTMLYVGAVEGRECYLMPKHVYRMGSEQAERVSSAERVHYAEAVAKPGFVATGKTWYADTTREPIRDETLRHGLLAVDAATERNLPTTSSRGRYRLRTDFARLFDPDLEGEDLAEAIEAWRAERLTPSALARIALIRAGASPDPDDYLVTFPNGETRRMSPGESSMITKAVIEEFAPRFLEQPHVVWVSESGNKVVSRDDIHARKLRLRLDVEKLLPDIILVDLAAMTIVFVEVVSTDGPINTKRRRELLALAEEGGHPESSVAFVTAFISRQGAIKKALPDLAWNSFVWVASEPEGLISLERVGTESVWLHQRLERLNG